MVRYGRGWAKCKCQIPTTDYTKHVRKERYKECSAKYKRGETSFHNLDFALRGVREHYTEDEIVKMGSLTREEVRRALAGQMPLL